MGLDRLVLGPPLLTGPTVILRSWERKDAEALSAAWSDPAVIAGSIPPTDPSIEAAEKWIEGVHLRADRLLALDMALADPCDDHVMGEVGLAKIAVERRAAMIGWWVAEADRGRHICTDGVSAMADWALQPGRLRSLIAEISPDNHASIRVAERAGFRYAGDAPNGGLKIFVRLRD